MYQKMASLDLTPLFRSCIKNVKVVNTAMCQSNTPTNILSQPQKSEFIIKSQDILSNIYHHQKLLEEHRLKYLKDDYSSFEETEKLYMEKVITTNFRIIDADIRNLESNLHNCKDSLNIQAYELRQNVINCLRANSMHVSCVFRDMKDLKNGRQKQKERLLILQCPARFRKEAKTSIRTANQPENTDRDDVSKSDRHFIEDKTEELMNQLSDQEKQQLEQENDHLHKELQSNKEEVRKITTQVVELSQMQEMLTDNVLIQSKQIDDIHNSILSSTDNVQRGNEEIRETMRRDAGFRIWIMFFIIVLSVTILFLDWFN